VYKWFFTIVCLFVLSLLCDKVCQWFASGQWFSMGTSGFQHQYNWLPYLIEILLKVALNTITRIPFSFGYCLFCPIYAFWLSPRYLQTWFTPSDYPFSIFKLDLRLLIIPSVPSNLIYAFWLSPRYFQTWFKINLEETGLKYQKHVNIDPLTLSIAYNIISIQMTICTI
jgi:hypothetical protein